jgi:hypothetical protein
MLSHLAPYCLFCAPRSPTKRGPGGSVSDRIQAAFGVHLEEVKKLLDAIRKKIFDNIQNCFEIVQVCLQTHSFTA